MRKLLITVCLALASCAPPAYANDRPAYYIGADYGGGTGDYEFIKGLIDPEVLVIIDGPCYSACTLYLTTTPKTLDICYTESAILGFHKPYQMASVDGVDFIFRTTTAIIAAEEAWQTDFLGRYPEGIQALLIGEDIPSVAAGAEKYDFAYLRARDLKGALKQCPDDWASYSLAPMPNMNTRLPPAQ